METQDQNQDKAKASKKAGGLLFVGCMFIGMAMGWYFDAYQIGMFGGIGVGFIMMAVVVMSNANRR
jgi:F0F1-type ATP synthase assembly protein I